MQDHSFERREWLSMFRSVAGVVLLGFACASGQAQSDPADAFAKLKALEGQWVGKTSDGIPVTTSFHVTSGGSAVLQMLGEGTEHEMPTLYHMDGNRLMATHYCAAQNQPRMVLAPASGSSSTMRFQFLDATNLASPDAGHMHSIGITLLGPDKLRQEWVFRQNGEEDADTFEFERKR